MTEQEFITKVWQYDSSISFYKDGNTGFIYAYYPLDYAPFYSGALPITMYSNSIAVLENGNIIDRVGLLNRVQQSHTVQNITVSVQFNTDTTIANIPISFTINSPAQCECGASKVGSSHHSHYCRLKELLNV